MPKDETLPFMVRYQIKRLWCGKCGRYTGGFLCTNCIDRWLEKQEQEYQLENSERSDKD